MTASAGERAMLFQLRATGMDRLFEREVAFAPPRKWRFDFADTDRMVAIEVEGGQWTGGHRHGGQFDAECEKYNEAALLGWTVIRVTPGMIEDGRAIDVIQRALRRALTRGGHGSTAAQGARGVRGPGGRRD